MSKIRVNWTCIVLCLLITFLSENVRSQQILSQRLRNFGVGQLVSQVKDWRLVKKLAWKNSIAQVPDQEKQYIIGRAEKYLDYRWPSLLAMKYLEYKVNGNRTNYEADVIERRQVLTNLVIGELLEKKGRFLPQIANGLWLTLEESTWVSPAHIVVQKGGAGLANPLDTYIDLATGRISADLATIFFLLREELNKLSPQLNNQIMLQLEKRILNPYIERDDFSWMAFNINQVNNWNIWINTNVLKTALLVDDNPDRLERLLIKLTRSADKFIDFYPEDGLCEEGPSYWSHAGGELGLMLDLLNDFSAGDIKFTSETKLHNIGSYIRYAHIAGKRFINYEDAESIQLPSSTKIWTYANLFNDNALRSFAAEMDSLRGHQVPLTSVQELLAYAEVKKDIAQFPIAKAQDVSEFYPSLQLAVVRQHVQGRDLFFSAIGGHNGVSHNHNDVGSFMLYIDTLPIFVDVGVGTYTKETFGPRRYELWNMQSQWHNTAVINDQQQRDGISFKATNTHFKKEGDQNLYTVDLAAAYPESASVASWQRSFYFSPKKRVLSVKEQYTLKTYSGKSASVLMTPHQPILEENTIKLTTGQGVLVFVEFNPRNIAVEIDKRIIDDPKIARNWGNEIYRIRLVAKSSDLKGKLDYQIKMVYP